MFAVIWHQTCVEDVAERVHNGPWEVHGRGHPADRDAWRRGTRDRRGICHMCVIPHFERVHALQLGELGCERDIWKGGRWNMGSARKWDAQQKGALNGRGCTADGDTQ